MIRLLLPTERQHHEFQKAIALALGAIALVFLLASCSGGQGSGGLTFEKCAIYGAGQLDDCTRMIALACVEDDNPPVYR